MHVMETANLYLQTTHTSACRSFNTPQREDIYNALTMKTRALTANTRMPNTSHEKNTNGQLPSSLMMPDIRREF